MPEASGGGADMTMGFVKALEKLLSRMGIPFTRQQTLALYNGLRAQYNKPIVVDGKIAGDFTAAFIAAARDGFRQQLSGPNADDPFDFPEPPPNNTNNGGSSSGSSGSSGPSGPSEFEITKRAFESIGARYGININANLVRWAMRNNVSPDEFALRAQAANMIKTNPAMFQQFTKALARAGIAKPGEINKKEVLKFVLGRGNAQWYKVWNITRARYVATQAGITLNKKSERYLSLNPGVVNRIAKKGLSDAALAQGFAEVAQGMSEVLPLSEARRFGVNKKDLVKSAFGGKGSQLSREQIQRAVNTYKAFQEERASAQSFVGEEGLGILSGVQRKQVEG